MKELYGEECNICYGWGFYGSDVRNQCGFCKGSGKYPGKKELIARNLYNLSDITLRRMFVKHKPNKSIKKDEE